MWPSRLRFLGRAVSAEQSAGRLSHWYPCHAPANRSQHEVEFSPSLHKIPHLQTITPSRCFSHYDHMTREWQHSQYADQCPFLGQLQICQSTFYFESVFKFGIKMFFCKSNQFNYCNFLSIPVRTNNAFGVRNFTKNKQEFCKLPKGIFRPTHVRRIYTCPKMISSKCSIR